MRVGFGYDVHRFIEGRDLILGGELISHPYGLKGHSDADVVIHALMDSLLGAACLGDIGVLFPDDDDNYLNISSIRLLESVSKILNDEGYTFVNADITIVCESPKIMPHSIKMRSNISKVLGCDISAVSIKATTEEGLGFTGSVEGVKCYAVCLLDNNL